MHDCGVEEWVLYSSHERKGNLYSSHEGKGTRTHPMKGKGNLYSSHERKREFILIPWRKKRTSRRETEDDKTVNRLLKWQNSPVKEVKKLQQMRSEYLAMERDIRRVYKQEAYFCEKVEEEE